MRVLLDTHAVIWAVAEPSRLSGTAAGVIEDPANPVLVSTVSAWEIAVKRALGKLDFVDLTPSLLDRYGFEVLDVGLRHTMQISSLPPLHRDPFDRMLVTQATSDDLTIVTHDEKVAAYDVATVW